MPPQPKKAPTKGAKQILTENTATVHFYRNMALAASLFYGVVTGALYYEDLFGWIINSPVNLIDDQESTFKNYYYPLSDEDETLPSGQDKPQKTKSSMTSNIDGFFEQPRPKKKKHASSTVGQSCKTGGISFISTNREDSTNATHLIKIEIFDLKKLAKVPTVSEHWKLADVRVKYYVDDQNKNNHFQQAKDVIYKITKEISESEECKKYHFNS